MSIGTYETEFEIILCVHKIIKDYAPLQSKHIESLTMTMRGTRGILKETTNAQLWFET